MRIRDLKHQNILIGVSCVPNNFDKEFITTIFHAIKNFDPKNICILCADTLQKYSHLADKHTNNKALALAKENGRTMKMLLEIVGKQFFDKLNIVDWETYCAYSGKTKNLFEMLYEKITSFKHLIDEISLSFYNKRYPSVTSIEQIRPKKYYFIRSYFLEELLGAARTVKIDHHLYDLFIYPVNKNDSDMHDSVSLSNLMQNDFNYIFENEIIPFLKNLNITSHPTIANEINNLDSNTKNQIFNSSPVNLLLMSNTGNLTSI